MISYKGTTPYYFNQDKSRADHQLVSMDVEGYISAKYLGLIFQRDLVVDRYHLCLIVDYSSRFESYSSVSLSKYCKNFYLSDVISLLVFYSYFTFDQNYITYLFSTDFNLESVFNCF